MHVDFQGNKEKPFNWTCFNNTIILTSLKGDSSINTCLAQKLHSRRLRLALWFNVVNDFNL